MKKILLADDDVTFLNLLKDVLENHGYSVIATKNGVEALEKIKSETCDMFILDILMPGIDGASILIELRQDKKSKDKPIIFISGTIKNDDKRSFEDENITYLPKPFEVEELLKIIDKNLANS